MENIKPFYDYKFHQWCISYVPKSGGYAAVWGDTEEECKRRYEDLIKKETKED